MREEVESEEVVCLCLSNEENINEGNVKYTM